MRRKKIWYYDKNGDYVNTVNDRPALTAKELAEMLKKKEQLLASTECPVQSCRKFKKPGYKLCYKCHKLREDLLKEHQLDLGRKEQERLAKKYQPKRKNRAKSKVINQLLAEPTNRSEPVQTVVTARPTKVLLRKANTESDPFLDEF